MLPPNAVLNLVVDGHRALTITQNPRVATFKFLAKGMPTSLRIIGPETLGETTYFCDGECSQILIIDRNREEHNFLYYGRYRVEFWDDDNPMVSLLADNFEVETQSE